MLHFTRIADLLHNYKVDHYIVWHGCNKSNYPWQRSFQMSCRAMPNLWKVKNEAKVGPMSYFLFDMRQQRSYFSTTVLFFGYIVYSFNHDDVIKWKHFPRYWPFVRGIHRSPVNSPHKGQWRGALMFSLICAWINGWVNNREAGD